MQRLSEYRVMWVMVFFDLPTNTNKEKRAYTIFRKDLMKRWVFTMFQIVNLCSSLRKQRECRCSCETCKSFMPNSGNVCIMVITDKQFGEIELFRGSQPQEPNAPGQQLELF